MQISSIRIQNFRALRDIEIPLNSSTVIIGENNTGKSSVLDCISLALSHRWGGQGTGFDDYDVSLFQEQATTSEPNSEIEGVKETGEEEYSEINIELLFQETELGEWPDEITGSLHNVLQVDPLSGRNSITLRVTYSFNLLEKKYEPGWSYIDINGDRLGNANAKRAANAGKLFTFVPVFLLSALRDSKQEFSSRSQFWGKLLKAVEISPEQRKDLDEAIDALNTMLLSADPRVAETLNRLKDIQKVVAEGAAADVQIRALPMKVWELLSRSEILIKGEEEAPWLPLDKNGQGVKSLSVIYLFKAFVERLLTETYSEHAEPIVALEEPEVHLHPQAARSLWPQINNIPGQKIITTHSPYFMQFVPMKDIRLLRRAKNGVNVHYVPEFVSVDLPQKIELTAFVAKYPEALTYDTAFGCLNTLAPITENQVRELLMCYTDDADHVHHPAIRSFEQRSRSLIIKKDLEDLEDWARRLRGEIFFARFWLLCEGQSEVFFFTALFNSLGLNLDAHGISLIDYQNNGSPSAFASLARTFGFPWFLFSDGDDQGKKTLASLKNVAFDETEISDNTLLLPDGADLEAYVVSTSWRDRALEVARQFDSSLSDTASKDEIAGVLGKNKPVWTRRFGKNLLNDPPSRNALPKQFSTVLTKLFGAVEQEQTNDAAD